MSKVSLYYIGLSVVSYIGGSRQITFYRGFHVVIIMP